MTSESLELQGRRLQLLSTRLTQRFYDRTAPFYSLSTSLFHTRAHRRVVELAGRLEGQTVLEVAMGSGELFGTLLDRNRTGLTVGVDLSPGMVAVVKKRISAGNSRNGHSLRRGRFLLQAADARDMPFPDGMFDALFNCYLFELQAPGDIERTIQEFHRVLRPGGKLLLVNPGDSSRFFNFIYGWLGYAVPSYWGRQVTGQISRLLGQGGFQVRHSEIVTQRFYPSLITVAER